MIIYQVLNNNANNGEIRYKWREETIRRILSNKIYLRTYRIWKKNKFEL